MTAAAIADLKSALGPSGWLEGEAAAPYAQDIRGVYKGRALLVARPGATSQVASVVAICGRHGVCITPQGGKTGLVGASVPGGDRPSIVLSLTRMNRVLSVDPARYTITVEAGCILEQVHAAAAEVDRAFAMDWGARGSATVGGGVSTNAGGINVLRFGVTRDQVLGLEVVLPDGRVWDGLRALRKDSSGYDLKHLFIGAEGTLGVVTKAVLKLYPRPREDRSMFIAVADLDRLMEIFTLARDVAGYGLTAFELIPGLSVELALAKYPSLLRPLQTRADWYVLVRFSGRDNTGDLLADLFERAHEARLVTDAALAQSSAQERNLWTLRDEIPPLNLMQGKMLKWDAAVPIDRIVPFLRAVERRAEEILPGARVYAFGHVGDGNLHLSVWPKGVPGDAAFDALCARMQSQIDALVWTFGGTICAEHGVGVENLTRLRGQKPPIELEMMARVRRLFDPAGIMNPGKILDMERM